MTEHMIFDIKLYDGFIHKYRSIADGHKFDTTHLIIYASDVSMDIVWVAQQGSGLYIF